MTHKIQQPRRLVRQHEEYKPGTIADKKAFVIVDQKHRPVFHRDGYILVFYRKKDAEQWLLNLHVNQENELWRIMKMNIHLELS